ncbi:MAG: MFS transporter [Clostridia bacterium]|nr:MFS transporter [Clostridia bacterium]
MAVLEKSKLFGSQKFDPYIKSANTSGSEKWLGYFFGPMGAAILNITIISYITVFYTDVLDMANNSYSKLWLAVFAVFPIVSKVIDAVTNIVMGQLIEKTRTRQGKARPWIFISAPLLSVACVLMFLIPEEHSVLQMALVILTYNVFFSFAYTIYNMSHTLMVPLSTSNVKQRDALSLFTNMGVNMIPGVVVSMLFPMVLLPVLGVDYRKWMVTMIILAAVALPFVVLEYFFTKERVTEAAASAGETASVPFKTQLKACFSSKSWVLMILYMLAYQIMANIQTVSLPYFCNWVLGTYNDGITQTILSAVGKFPLGFGVFLLWPLVKKFGKRKVMIIGFSIAAAAMLLCLFFSRNLPIMLAGSMIFSIGFLPSYVYSALMADTLDWVEYDKGIRVDGLTASIFTIIATVSVGIGQGLHNLGISMTGYEQPKVIDTIIAENGAQKLVYNVQNAATQNFIAFEYIGVPMIMLAVMALIMVFLKVEDKLPMVHEALTSRRKAECEARGETYIDPEEKARLEQAENDRLAEETRIRELKERCSKKGLDFDEEEAKYQARLAAKQAKAEAKKK